MISHPTLAAIAAHTLALTHAAPCCKTEVCPKCGDRPLSFAYHGLRSRQFLVLVERVMHCVLSALSRWKCPSCGKSFTDYPSFALPYKRIVRQDLCALSDQYVTDDDLSYRKAVQVDRMAICYHTDGQTADDRVLWPSTLHRWVGFLGRLKNTLQQALRLIRSKSATCDVFRQVVAVPCWKYRSDERRLVLQTCGRLLGTDRAYQKFFDRSVFPELATLHSWT